MATKIEAPAVPVWEKDPHPDLGSGWRHRVLSRLLGLPTREEVERELAEERSAEENLPERVPPDDPGRLAWEAQLRALGYTPAQVWNFPIRKPIRKPDWRHRVRDLLGG